MIITLSDGTQIEIVSINFVGQSVDWRRTGEGYQGVCNTYLGVIDYMNMMTQITAAIETEIVQES